VRRYDNFLDHSPGVDKKLFLFYQHSNLKTNVPVSIFSGGHLFACGIELPIPHELLAITRDREIRGHGSPACWGEPRLLSPSSVNVVPRKAGVNGDI